MKQKKLLFSLFALFTAMTAWGQEEITGLTYNSEGGFYEIHDVQDIIDLHKYVNSHRDATGKTFKQMENIAFRHDTEWNDGTSTENNYKYTDGYEYNIQIGGYPGNVDVYFNHTYDGQGYTISGIRYYGGDSYKGIFGRIGSGGTIRNVVLADTRIVNDTWYNGGIVGENAGGTITNCRVGSDVFIGTNSTTSEKFGGIVGKNVGGIVSGCTSAATVKVNSESSQNNYGGIAGSNENGTVMDCLYIGTNVSSYLRFGAIVGGNYGKSATVQNCYFTNSSVAEGKAVGYNEGGTVTNTGLAYTITLGDKVWVNTAGSEDYTCGDLIAFTFTGGGYALQTKSSNVLYSTNGITIDIRHDDYPGYTFNGFSYNDGSDHDIEGNSFTMPAANVSVNASWTENVLELANDAYNSSDISAAVAGGKTYNRVILNGRSLTKNGNWNTLCLPFSMTAEEIATSPLAGAIIKEMDEESTYSVGTYTLSLKFKTATRIEAGKPYIVKWADDSGTVGNPLTFNLVTITSATPSTVSSSDGAQVNFVGTYGPQELSTTSSHLYMGTDNNLYYPKNSGFYVNAFRGYFRLGKLNGEVKAIVMDFGDDDADGLRQIDNGQLIIDNEMSGWYSLDGRKLSGKPAQHGIYIHNGRKEVLK
ncbi:MAG: hypothetical protein IJS63_08855 [Bacteroidaceae bacterium]|nr:hypothetical protein [Bacteroidaceae bacterium]